MNRKPKLERRRLADLVDHPHQPAYAGTTTEQEDEDLKFSISEDKLRDPIEIIPENQASLPANTIFDGHRRKIALLALGEKTVAVLVRYDLANADRPTIDRLFLDANSVRRQLDSIAKAYIAAKQMEIEHNRPLGELLEGGWEADELRDRVGKLLGLSGRHLSRLLNVIRTPIEVQAAVRQKKLSIVLAEKVAALSQSQQGEIAERIRAGEDAKVVVESVVGTVTAKPKNVETAYVRYLRALEKSVEHLRDGLHEIKFAPKPEELAVLDSASELNTALAKQLRTNEQRNEGKRGRALTAIRDELDPK